MRGKSVFIPAVAALTLLFVSCSDEREKDSSAPENQEIPYVVRTEKAQKRVLRDILVVYMNATPSYNVDVSPKISGEIEIFPVGGGSRVKKGDLLFQTDRFQLEEDLAIATENLRVSEASYRKSEIDVDVAKQRCRKAEIDFERNKRLYNENEVSKDKLEQYELTLSAETSYVKQAESALELSRAKVEQARSSLSISERKLSDSRMLAPFDGTVVDTYADLHEYASSGQKVLRIESSNELELSSFVSGRLYNEIKVGVTRAVISCPATGYKAEVPVSYKASFIDPVSRTFEFKLKLPSKADVLSGMLCRAEIVLRSAEEWSLPSVAFLPRPGGLFAVFADVDGRAEMLIVKEGLHENGYTGIVDPPSDIADMRFVVMGQAYIDPGMRLTEAVEEGE